MKMLVNLLVCNWKNLLMYFIWLIKNLQLFVGICGERILLGIKKDFCVMVKKEVRECEINSEI